VLEAPGLTRENYEETVRRITGGKQRMSSRSDWPVEGLLVHIARQGPRGFRVAKVANACRLHDLRDRPSVLLLSASG